METETRATKPNVTQNHVIGKPKKKSPNKGVATEVVNGIVVPRYGIERPAPKSYVFKATDTDLLKLYRTHWKTQWTDIELDFTEDVSDFADNTKFNDDTRHFIKRILAFFLVSDGLVVENLTTMFSNEPGLPQESQLFFGIQTAMEHVHALSYTKMVEAVVPDEAERDALFACIETIPTIGKKAEWAQKYMDPKVSFAERVVAFAVVEGVFFSGAFCAIFWLQTIPAMPGLRQANQMIARDEALHRNHQVVLYNKYIRRLPQKRVYAIVSEAVDIETEFICDALPKGLVGINAEMMTDYIKLCADNLLAALNYKPLYGATNPFPFMNTISMEGKTNFFEYHVTEYQHVTSSAIADDQDDEYSGHGNNGHESIAPAGDGNGFSPRNGVDSVSPTDVQQSLTIGVRRIDTNIDF